jgi:hypothetical protein
LGFLVRGGKRFKGNAAVRRKKTAPEDAPRDTAVLTPLERELLDGLAEIIAADILRVRLHGDSYAESDYHDDAPEAASC